MVEPLIIRADASAEIGTGHVMRCFALAQAWQRDGGTVQFAHAQITPALQQRLVGSVMGVAKIEAAPGSVADAELTAQLARESGATWVVVDGYHFDSAYQDALNQAGLRVLLIDDFGHTRSYSADLVLNQNLGAAAALYRERGAQTQLLLGPRYALLRDEFQPWRDWERTIPARATKLLVSLGGSDPDNVTGLVIEALQGLSDIETLVLVGGSNPHRVALEAVARESGSAIRLLVDVTNVSELMASADLAVAAGGSTCWELAFMGLPSLLVVIADNQEPIAREMERAGVARHLGRSVALDRARIASEIAALAGDGELRAEMSRRGREVVDGRGTDRVVRFMQQQVARAA